MTGCASRLPYCSAFEKKFGVGGANGIRREDCTDELKSHKMGRSAFPSRIVSMKISGPTNSPSISLVAPRPMHAKLWFAWRNEAQARRNMPIEPWSINALKKRLDAAKPDLSAPDQQEHRWIVQVDAESAGIVSILRPVVRHGYAEISYHLAEAYQGRGIGTAAVARLIDLVFDQTEYRRLFALISVRNQPSRCLAEKLGFVHEGTLRGHFVIGGRPVDQCVYGLLRKEWKPTASR